MRRATTLAARESSAAATNTVVALPVASSTPASTGPTRAPPASSAPRTTLALVSSCVLMHSVGSSAEWAGRKMLNTTVAAIASAYTAVVDPPVPRTSAARPMVTNRAAAMAASTRSRRMRSAYTLSTGEATAAGSIRSNATHPTVDAPPSRNATTPSATVSAASPVHVSANAACALPSSGLAAVWRSAVSDAPSRPLSVS